MKFNTPAGLELTNLRPLRHRHDIPLFDQRSSIHSSGEIGIAVRLPNMAVESRVCECYRCLNTVVFVALIEYGARNSSVTRRLDVRYLVLGFNT